MMLWRTPGRERSWNISSSCARRPGVRSTAALGARSARFCASANRTCAPFARRAGHGTHGRCAMPSWRKLPALPSAPILTSPDSHRLTHAADAPRHGAHDVEREVRHLVDHEAEFALIDQGEFARLLDASGRASRRAVDHRHESDRLVWPANLDHLVADHHLDYAGLHDVHARARIALVEDDASG